MRTLIQRTASDAMTMRLTGELSRKMTEHHADMRNEATRTAISVFDAALLPEEFPQNYPGRNCRFRMT
jgi:hypothetical protein